MNNTQSVIYTGLAVDPPLAMPAGYQFDNNDRRYIDNQLQGVEQLLVQCLIRGTHATFVKLSGSSVAVVPGDTVCLASQVGATEAIVTKSTSAALANAQGAYGVVILAGSPGAYILVAIDGAVSPAITGLAASAQGFVRVNTTTGRCQEVASIGSGDYALGSVDAAGWMQVSHPGVTSGGGSVGGASGQVLSNQGGAETGSSHLTFNSTTGGFAVGADGTGFLTIGNSPAGTGDARFGAASTVAANNSSGVAPYSTYSTIFATTNTGGAGSLYFGSDPALTTGLFSAMYMYPYGSINFGLNNTTYLLMNVGVQTVQVYGSTALALGNGTGNPASTGRARFCNNDAINARNAANTADISLISTDASNNVYVGDTANAASARIQASGVVMLDSNSQGVAEWAGGGFPGWLQQPCPLGSEPSTNIGYSYNWYDAQLRPKCLDIKNNKMQMASVVQALSANFTTNVVASNNTNHVIAAAANDVWVIDVLFSCNSPTNGMQLQISTPAGATVEGDFVSASTTGVVQQLRVNAINTLVGPLGPAGADCSVIGHFTVTLGATAGNIQVGVASTTAAQVSTVYKGSYIEATQASVV